ncbi:MAG: hypothetical protein LBG19_10895 [Prevotellaceae bacterium]|jgi:hypothetical protein|nr:hypothetical protein [Prevotellaceae bacterium]
MKSTEFIVQRLRLLSTDFKEIYFSYSYHSQYSIHKILVSSKDVYNSPSYIESELNLYLNFIEEYPDDMLLFISEDDYYIPFENPTHTVFAGEVIMND